jgi:hypothetical protein
VKIIFASILALTLGACAALAPSSSLSPSQQLLAAQQARNTACGAWEAAFSTAVAIRQAGQASSTLIQQVNLADSQLTPVCTSPLPTDIQTIQSQTTQVMTSVGILEYLTKVSKK